MKVHSVNAIVNVSKPKDELCMKKIFLFLKVTKKLKNSQLVTTVMFNFHLGLLVINHVLGLMAQVKLLDGKVVRRLQN